jgi:H+/Na+-translocating ferredoxin:NAD+ oxidoreductase subunit B
MQQNTKPRIKAFVRENDCIGCTKCIQACPVDAIIGSAKHMHTVIAAECVGCKLCLPPCPVDCIDLHFIIEEKSREQRLAQAQTARSRFQARNKRLQEENLAVHLQLDSLAQKKKYIEAAKARVREKKRPGH